MVGGLSNTYELEDEFADDVPKDEKGCPKDYPPYLVEEIETNTVGGGKFFREAWIYDGSRWSPTEPMSSVRDNPVCSLVEMDDGEVLKTLLFPKKLEFFSCRGKGAQLVEHQLHIPIHLVRT